jgi:hypothetical protein
MIASTKFPPMFFTAESPKRMVPPTTVKRCPLVYVRRQDLYVHRPCLGDAAAPGPGVHDAAHERGHVRLG